MNQVVLKLGNDWVKAYTMKGVLFYILREDFTPDITKACWQQGQAFVPYIMLTKDEGK